MAAGGQGLSRKWRVVGTVDGQGLRFVRFFLDLIDFDVNFFCWNELCWHELD